MDRSSVTTYSTKFIHCEEWNDKFRSSQFFYSEETKTNDAIAVIQTLIATIGKRNVHILRLPVSVKCSKLCVKSDKFIVWFGNGGEHMNAFLIWIIILIVCLVIEIISLGLTTIWFSGGALIAAIAAIFNVPIPVQVGLFLVVSILLFYFTRPIALKYFNNKRVKTNVDSLIGTHAKVLAPINNVEGSGKVMVNGQEWSAKSDDEKSVIAEGQMVEVLSVAGVKLVVRPVHM